MPADTELWGGIIMEATNISPNQRNAKELEIQDPCNRILQHFKSRVIISEPMATEGSMSCIGTARYKYRSFLELSLNKLSSGLGFHGSIERVYIVFQNILGFSRVRCLERKQLIF